MQIKYTNQDNDMKKPTAELISGTGNSLTTHLKTAASYVYCIPLHVACLALV